MNTLAGCLSGVIAAFSGGPDNDGGDQQTLDRPHDPGLGYVVQLVERPQVPGLCIVIQWGHA